MYHEKILKIIMAHSGGPRKAFPKRLNKNESYFKRLYRKRASFCELVKFLDHLNYEVVFQPKGRNLPDYSYRITWEDYKDLPYEPCHIKGWPAVAAPFLQQIFSIVSLMLQF